MSRYSREARMMLPSASIVQLPRRAICWVLISVIWLSNNSRMAIAERSR